MIKSYLLFIFISTFLSSLAQDDGGAKVMSVKKYDCYDIVISLYNCFDCDTIDTGKLAEIIGVTAVSIRCDKDVVYRITSLEFYINDRKINEWSCLFSSKTTNEIKKLESGDKIILKNIFINLSFADGTEETIITKQKIFVIR